MCVCVHTCVYRGRHKGRGHAEEVSSHRSGRSSRTDVVFRQSATSPTWGNFEKHKLLGPHHICSSSGHGDQHSSFNKPFLVSLKLSTTDLEGKRRLVKDKRTATGRRGEELPGGSPMAWLVYRVSDAVGHKSSLDIWLGQRLESPGD